MVCSFLVIVSKLNNIGDDSQLLMYDLTDPLPTPEEIDPQAQKTSRSKSYTLSPATTPAITRTPSPAALANEILPTKAWSGESEINNLAFTSTGDRVGCVSGSRMSVLTV